MLWVYQLCIGLYGKIVLLMSLTNSKAKRFITGRKSQQRKLKNFPAKTHQRFWIHAASLGEFEQGRTIIEEIRKSRPNSEIILTFFSPSGYEIRKNFTLVDHVLYLPLDTSKNAFSFVNSIRPDLVIFIKYDFWYYYLIELKRRKIPVVFVSSLFRSNQFYFHRTVGFMRKALSSVNHFFVQDIKSKNLLSTIGISQTTVAGDTRLDRVVSQSKEQISYPIVESFVEGERVILFGSVWPSDMDVCLEFIKLNIQKFKFIIAPHNLKNKEIVDLLKLPNSFKYSAPPVDSGEQKVMVIDNYGMLSSLYRYATIAYVGGGFNGTLHNTMEAAVYEIPVIWGKHLNNKKFLEAKGLIDCGAGYEVSNREDLLVAFQYLEDVEIYIKSAKAAKKYVSDRTGATKKIMLKIEEILC